MNGLDRPERVYLDRHCHGLLEWCTLHSRRKDYSGMCWIKPRLSPFDHVFVASDTKSITNWNKILKFLGEGTKHLYLIKTLSSAKDFSEAKGLFDKVDWVLDSVEENPFVQL